MPDGRPAMLLEIPSDQASAATTAADGALWVAGTTDARVLRLQPTPRASGRWLSAAIDAGAVADWGRVDWDADVPRGAKLRVHVRAGNTDEPDETWHEWVELNPKDGGAGGVIPPSRYFQTRFILESSRGGESPSLRAVELRYRARNRPPEITQLTVEPSGVVYTRGPVAANRRGGPLVLEDPVSRVTIESLRPKSTRGPVRRSFEQGARTVTWKAADPDQDRLRFRLEIRREESDHWSPLAAEVGDEFHSWDARGLRDGSYRLRLTADDAMDNPADASLRVQRISARFRVDHTRPSIGEPRFERRAEGVNIEFEATDRGGSVAVVEVALDGEGWTMVDPLDGVADSASERYRLTVEPGHETRTVDVRVVDAAGNLGGDSWSIDPAE